MSCIRVGRLSLLLLLQVRVELLLLLWVHQAARSLILLLDGLHLGVLVIVGGGLHHSLLIFDLGIFLSLFEFVVTTMLGLFALLLDTALGNSATKVEDTRKYDCSDNSADDSRDPPDDA